MIFTLNQNALIILKSKFIHIIKMLNNVSDSPLGKTTTYVSCYKPSLLYAIPRKNKRDEINIPQTLPFHGFDTWNAYEISWLNPSGIPQVAIAQFDIECTSENIIESKSFKLYLNSFNNTKFDSKNDVLGALHKDIQLAVNGKVAVKIFSLEDFSDLKIKNFEGECLDKLEIYCDTYIPDPNLLISDENIIIEEVLFSHLLKSNCLVTGQPDWGSVQIYYHGPKIHKESLLKYIISFRNHNEFHEQCVERIFMDILLKCKPNKLKVEARYTRRGGLDINPMRSTEFINPTENIRMARQ